MAEGRWAGPLDALFLIGETPSTLMHVGSLLTFETPPGESSAIVKQLVESVFATEVDAPWTLRLAAPSLLRSPVNRWVEDPDFDLSYHVRHSALPSPGGERELGVLVSRLHSNQLDFTRPPWEVHVVEGLEGDRFAVYVKIHHSLVDGFTGMKMLRASLSSRPDQEPKPFFYSFARMRAQRRAERAAAAGGAADEGALHPASPDLDAPLEAADGAGGAFGEVPAGVAEAVGQAQRAAAGLVDALTGGLRKVANVATSWVETQVGDPDLPDLVSSHAAPGTIFNSAVGRNRRFATQLHDLTRYRAVAAASGGTVNDVLVAVCGGAIRRFLLELGELPDDPVVAFLPVNVRPADSPGGGNMVGATLVSLGTHLADPAQRMHHVIASTAAAKRRMAGMSKEEIIAYSGLLLAPAAMQYGRAVSGLPLPVPYAFNLCISNVPGPAETLWWGRARLVSTHPLSIVMHSMALNITAHSYAGSLALGFLGDRDAIPRLQRMAVYAGDELGELERSFGVG